MDFDEWHASLCCQDCHERCEHKEWERKAWDAALTQARAEERKTIESVLVKVLQFQSCMCLQRCLNSIRARGGQP